MIIEADPKRIQEDYRLGKQFKESLDGYGLYEQSRINELYMLDKHWENADIGDEIPMPVLNVIRQIISYKIANIVSNRTDAIFTFEGVPCYQRELSANDPNKILDTVQSAEATENEKLDAVAQALSSHFNTTWERAKMDSLLTSGMRKCAISGTMVIYSPFDPDIKTGMYLSNKTPIKGDIAPELLDIQNVYFGDPNNTDVEKQPYILITQRLPVYQVQKEAKKAGIDEFNIRSDSEMMTGNSPMPESDKRTERTTVITKFWREDEEIFMIRICGETVLKGKTSTGLTRYPISVFSWHERDNCIYGYSEITGMIPNQVIINQMLSFQVLATMLTGFPVIVYNQEAITSEITNSPGQIIPVLGNADVQQAFRFVSPPTLSPNWDIVLQNLIVNTKVIAGATDAALGDVRPDNTSAIIALRETAALPLQPMLNRYYDFIEDIARIWGEIFIKKYSKRNLKIVKDGQVFYIPFDANKYKDNIVSVHIDVGANSLWDNSTIISTLNSLLMLNKISVADFLERIPDGYINKRHELIQRLREAEKAAAEREAIKADLELKAMQGQTQGQTQEPIDINNILSQLTPEEQDILNEHPELFPGSEIQPPQAGTV